MRKLEAKGKKDGKVETTPPAPAGEAAVEKASPGDEEEGEEEEDGREEGKGGGGQFVKRKIGSNAWRYEEEEELPGEGNLKPHPLSPHFCLFLFPSPSRMGLTREGCLRTEVEEPPPEPDYVKMTIGRRGELEDPEIAAAPSEGVDEGFLNESLLTQGKRHGEGARGKGRVFKVDRSQFEDVTEKISKQSTADAFRQRFAPRKAKPRRGGAGQVGIGGVRGEYEETEGAEDVDSFLEELNLDGETEPFHPLSHLYLFWSLFFFSGVSWRIPVRLVLFVTLLGRVHIGARVGYTVRFLSFLFLFLKGGGYISLFHNYFYFISTPATVSV